MEKLNADKRKKESSERIQSVGSGEPVYPARLKEIRDYPKKLYYIGRADLLNSLCAAVIGSRTSTAYGRNTAKAVGRCLASNEVTVVSGLASGIDTCAHQGALNVRGNTIAVLGCGPDICYPADNRLLKSEIEKKGLIVSEYPPGTQPRPYHFPQRNRIISGLSEEVIVVQARIRSGALITAELAAEQGREVCAVPGNIDSQYHRGTNQLIREGVTPIASIEDVLEPLGLSARGKGHMPRGLSKTEQKIVSLLSDHGEMNIDEICMELELQPSYLLPVLSALELKGALYSAMGKFFLANQ